jgi:two-component system, OmpR family, sensor histidine kinase KdpD
MQIVGYESILLTVPTKTRWTEHYGYLVAIAFVAVATGMFLLARPYFGKSQWALLYLLIVAFVAGLSGIRPALLAAGLSFLTWNFFFLPPYGTFRVHDSKDWLSLFVFLLVGVLIGIQTSRLRERQAEARAHEREAKLLNRFASALVSDISESEMGQLLIGEVTTITQADCAALFLVNDAGELTELVASPGATCQRSAEVRMLLAWVQRQAKAVGLGERTVLSHDDWPVSVSHRDAGVSGPRSDVFLPLQTSMRLSGVLYIGPLTNKTVYSAYEVRLLVALANQASVFLERRYLQEVAIQADATRKADLLKSTLVSAVSHELKTPLAALTATVSNLLEEDIELDRATVTTELQAMQSDLARLNNSIGNLIDLSRLAASEWQPQMDWYDFGEILGSVLARLSAKERSRVVLVIPEDLPAIRVDFPQWIRVLQNLIENALKYGGTAGKVRIGASASATEIRMWVDDEGSGVAPEERHRVFDRFYRGERASAGEAGTGLGLAISTEIVRFHNGRIWVEDAKPHGARFVISLPQEAIKEKAL